MWILSDPSQEIIAKHRAEFDPESSQPGFISTKPFHQPGGRFLSHCQVGETQASQYPKLTFIKFKTIK